MKKGLLKDLTKELYTEWKKEERRFKKPSLFGDLVYNDFFVLLYGLSRTPSFDDLIDVDGYLDTAPVDCIVIITRQEVEKGYEEELQIYEWELNSYEIKDNCLTVNLRNNVTKKFIL